MPDGLRKVHMLTADESLLASARAAVQALDGWEFANPRALAELAGESSAVAVGDVVLLDGGVPGVYETCRRLTGRTRCRTFVVVDEANEAAEAIARFCGATGVLHQPMTAAELRAVVEAETGRAPLASDLRGDDSEPMLPVDLLRDLEGGPHDPLIDALVDPETQLFNYAFLNYKLEEEFKRSQRFGHPLSCVMLGFEGEASEQVLRELAGIFLSSSRDTDILGRFDVSSFLFLLPHTGPDGAAVMAHRVEEAAAEAGLRDLVGDALQISVGISSHPHPEIERREDLYAAAREAFLEAQGVGGGVVTSA
jgi:diguanylate cyclase (GGDEF)-like protein